MQSFSGLPLAVLEILLGRRVPKDPPGPLNITKGLDLIGLNEPNRTSNVGIDFLYSYLNFTAAYSLKSEKIGMLNLLNCDAASLTVFTAMCPEKQQTCDKIVKDNCFIIEIFDKFSFSGILMRCLRLIANLATAHSSCV